MTLAAAAAAQVGQLVDVVDAVAQASGSWVLVEQFGELLCHGVGDEDCTPALTRSLTSKTSGPLRAAAVWRRGSEPLTGEVEGQPLVAVDLGDGACVWFVGGHAPAHEAAFRVSAALHGQQHPLYDAVFESLLRPRGPSRAGAAPQAQLIAVSGDGPTQRLARKVSGSMPSGTRAHIDDGTLLLAVPLDDDVHARGRTILERCPTSRVGLARTHAGAADWQEAAEQASGALAAARRLGLRLGDSDDPQVALEMIVERAGHAAANLWRGLPSDPFRALTAHDTRNSGELRRSLAAWCRAGFDVAEAAAELHVHVNTLRYRIKRGEEIAGICLDGPRCRLALQLLLGSDEP